MKQTLRVSSDVRFRAVGDETVLIRQEAAEVIVLNEVGGRILELVQKHGGLENWIDALHAEWDVERAELEHDVEAFLAELCESGVLEEAS